MMLIHVQESDTDPSVISEVDIGVNPSIVIEVVFRDVIDSAEVAFEPVVIQKEDDESSTWGEEVRIPNSIL